MDLEKLMTLEMEYLQLRALENILKQSKSPIVVLNVIPNESEAVPCANCGEIHGDYSENAVAIEDLHVSKTMSDAFRSYVETRQTHIRKIFAQHKLTLANDAHKRGAHLHVVKD